MSIHTVFSTFYNLVDQEAPPSRNLVTSRIIDLAITISSITIFKFHLPFSTFLQEEAVKIYWVPIGRRYDPACCVHLFDSDWILGSGS